MGMFDFVSDAASSVGDAVSNVGHSITGTAEKLTGNKLGIPGLDMNMIKRPFDIGHWAPVTKGAFAAGVALLGGAALSGSGTISEAAATSSAGAGDMFGSGVAYEEGAGQLASQTLTGTAGAGATSLTEGVTGLSGEAGKNLALEGAGDAFGAGEAFQTGAANIATTEGAVPAGGKGLLGSFVKENPTVTAAGVLTAGGLLKGIGERSANMEMLERKRIEEEKAIEAKRTRIQGSSYYDAHLPFNPNQGAVLRRPDGTPVYSGPLLTSLVR